MLALARTEVPFVWSRRVEECHRTRITVASKRLLKEWIQVNITIAICTTRYPPALFPVLHSRHWFADTGMFCQGVT